MRAIIFSFLVLAALIISISCEEPCKQGESKKEDCNTCTCAANGLWACTRKLCIPGRDKRGTYCEPGKSFKKDCNTCVCNADGTNAACTLKACL